MNWSWIVSCLFIVWVAINCLILSNLLYKNCYHVFFNTRKIHCITWTTSANTSYKSSLLIMFYSPKLAIATIQGRADQNCQHGVVLLSENYHHTAPPPTWSLNYLELFNTMSTIPYYAIQHCIRSLAISYSIAFLVKLYPICM